MIYISARKTLNNRKVKTPKVSYEEERSEEDMLYKSKDFKSTKRQKFLRGGKPSSSQRRLLACIPLSDITEENRKRSYLESEAADDIIAGSDIGRKAKSKKGNSADQETEKEKWKHKDKRLANERYVDSRWFSDNANRRNSFKDLSAARRSKSESDIDLNTESTDQNLLEEEMSKGNVKKESEKDRHLLRNQTPCEMCQRLLNDVRSNRIICTAF